MTTTVQKSTIVNVPVSVAYNQWTQFEDFPQFMGGVTSVTQLTDHRLEWVAEIAGVRRQWEARILEQVPDQKVSWAATSGATNAGTVSFEPAGEGATHVHLHLEYEPEGLVEKIGDQLNIVEKQAEGDLERFKAFIESEGYATGSWRGTVNPGANATPDVSDASSQGDSGKAGVSPTAVAAGIGLAAVATAAAVAATRGGSGDDAEDATAHDVTATDSTTVGTVGTVGAADLTVTDVTTGDAALTEDGDLGHDEANLI